MSIARSVSSAALGAARIRLSAAAAASRSPAVVAPSNSAAIFRSFWRSSCSVVIVAILASWSKSLALPRHPVLSVTFRQIDFDQARFGC